MREHFPTIWSLITRTRPMWGMIPLRIMFGVVIILQGLERLTGIRHSGSLLGTFSHEWQIVFVLIFSFIEILAGLMAIPGMFVRFVGFTVVVEMALAVFFESLPLDFSGSLQAQMLVIAIAGMMIFSGAGRWSIDHYLAKKHLKKYPSKKWELYTLAETPLTKWWE